MANRKVSVTPVEALNSNMNEVWNLVDIHAQVSQGITFPKHNVEILNKSAIVLVVACWEAFVEDASQKALEFIIERLEHHSILPKVVLERVASKHTGIKAWDFAGEGWKTCLRNNLTEVLARTTGALNTPRTAQVNELFYKTIGVKNVSSCWAWKGRTRSSAERALDNLISLRGEIAHRVATDTAVRKVMVKTAIDLVFRLSVKTANFIRLHVHDLVGEYPWKRRRFGSVA